MAAFRILSAALCLLASSAAFAEDPLPRAKPEEVGMSSERLARIGATSQGRHRRGPHSRRGYRDRPARQAGRTRRLWLARQGGRRRHDHRHHLQHRLDDQADDGGRRADAVRAGPAADRRSPQRNISRNSPRCASPCATPMASRRPIPCRPLAQITIQDLMRHTSGLIYGGRGTTLVHKMYPAGSGDASRDYDGAAFLDKLASLPLLYQPATAWDYGFGLDIARPHDRKDQPADARAISARPICSRRSA